MPIAVKNTARFNTGGNVYPATPAAVSSALTATVSTGSSGATALTARPNDGSGYWADASNTGHTKGPNATATASLVNYTSGMTATGGVIVQETNGTVITGRRFTGKSYLGYLGVGDNLTFRNCLFEGTFPNDNLVQVYCATRFTFEYCTFRPFGLTVPAGNTSLALTTSLTDPGTPYSQSWQYIAGMTVGQTARFDHCDVWGNAGIQCTGGQSASVVGTFVDCYIHDQADTNSSGAPGGQEYHHDGIGPDSEGGSGYTLIQRCTIASRGNTNAIALQGSSTYHHITIADNYIAGFGYAVSIGATTPWQGTNITVTGNIYSAEVDSVFGPFYNVGNWNTGGGTNTWSNNRFQVRSGDQESTYTTADHGKYWWPSDNSSHAADF